MSWEDIVKFERNPYSDRKSYVRQIEKIAEDIEKIIKVLENERRYIYKDIVDVDYAIKLLKEINTET